ncbi:MAG: right-handed parallel beta-helix repeat-containing protein [Candidatus Brocadiae bacterium]|nr:right-handed parallel beta-helix repeat-containing protein [Candidatus Brocadiia bacterium]
MSGAMVSAVLMLLVVHGIGAPADREPGAEMPAVGPRGAVGADVPLSDAEEREFATRVTVEGRTDGAVQAACERALEEGTDAVFLPAGRYVFQKEVRVPGGLTLFGEGPTTLCQTEGRDTHLFRVDGDGVRFTRLKLQGADTSQSKTNNTYGINVSGKQNIRIDHCELLGFSYATNFASEATAQVDHCYIHDCPRDGLGYGVAVYSGAYVLVMDNEFSQCRHCLASNGSLDWGSPRRLGRYVHKPGFRKTHWEFTHNRVNGDDRTRYRLCAVDTHPGMDGTFVVENNIFENVRHGVGIRDGSGIIRGNLFRNLSGRRPVGISISYGEHNGIPVEGCMPHDVEVQGSVFVSQGAEPEKYRIGRAENIIIDGQLVPQTRSGDRAQAPMPRLVPMDAEGILRVARRD